MNDLGPKTADNLRKVRESKPLVHNITNFVVMNFTANVLLASGASPVMAHAENEVEEMVDLAGALVLNIGTLSDSWIAAMSKAGSRATARQTPIVLDPVGAGATALRTATARRLLAACQVSVLRGNASEILALADSGGRTRGSIPAMALRPSPPPPDTWPTREKPPSRSPARSIWSPMADAACWWPMAIPCCRRSLAPAALQLR
jgi:hypothetical protein